MRDQENLEILGGYQKTGYKKRQQHILNAELSYPVKSF